MDDDYNFEDFDYEPEDLEKLQNQKLDVEIGIF